MQSVLNDSVEYVINKDIDSEDLGLESCVYELEIFNVSVALTLGKIKRDYANKDIFYCSVYIIVSNTILEKIGYYEFYQGDTSALLDKDGDMDLSVMEGPLLFDYIDFDYLSNLVKKSKFLREFTLENKKYEEDYKQSDDVDENIKKANKFSVEGKEDIEIIDNINSIDNIEKIRTPYEGTYNKKINKRFLDVYNKNQKASIITENSTWLQKYYNNNLFNILDNEGGGDCFFAVIRDGLKDIGININVPTLRHILSKQITEEQFTLYKSHYNNLNSEILTLKNNIEKLTQEAKAIKREYIQKKKEAIALKKANKLNEVKEKLIQANQLVKQSKLKIKDVKHFNSELSNALTLMTEFKFMKDIENIEEFKTVIKSKNYWADSLSIALLENVLNIKCIVFSKVNFDKGNFNNLISCGDFVLNDIEKRGSFKPKYYIIAIYDGQHYTLMKYKSLGIFSFYEIPYVIKEAVVESCMKAKPENSKTNDRKNTYYYIPNFIGFANDIEVNLSIYEERLTSGTQDELQAISEEMMSKLNSKKSIMSLHKTNKLTGNLESMITKSMMQSSSKK